MCGCRMLERGYRMHKRGWGARLLLLALSLAAAALWGRACWDARALVRAHGGVSVRMEMPVAGEKLARLLRQEPDGPVFCAAAWTRGEQAEALFSNLGTETALRVYAVFGDMRQAAPIELLSGSFPTEDDDRGCLLDESSAEALFRSVEITGAAVEIGGKPYYVRGVVRGGEAAAYIRNADAAYENLEFAVRAGGEAEAADFGKAEAEAFVYRHALSGAYALVQSGLYARILYGLAFLPAALLPLSAAVGLVGAAGRAFRKKRLSGLAPLIAAALCLGCVVLLLAKTFFWPQAFLPTRCADFAFWGTLAESWRQAWSKLSLLPPLPRDTAFYRAMRACLSRLGAALALEAILLMRIRNR